MQNSRPLFPKIKNFAKLHSPLCQRVDASWQNICESFTAEALIGTFRGCWKDAPMYRQNRGTDRTRALFTRCIVSRLGRYPQDQRHHSLPQRETLTVRRSWPDPKPCGNSGYSRARRSRDILTMLLLARMFAAKKNPVEFARIGERHSAATRGARRCNVETMRGIFRLNATPNLKLIQLVVRSNSEGYGATSLVSRGLRRTSNESYNSIHLPTLSR